MSAIKLFIVASFLSMTNIGNAQSLLQIPKAKRPPVIAEYTHGVPADAGVMVSDFKQNEPGDGIPASKETKAYLSYDASHFYAVFVAKDDPKLVRSRIAKRDDFWGDDFVSLELDTFHDKQRAFVFFTNSYGVQVDAKRTEGLDMDFNFDTQWYSEGEMTADGYVAMIAIPFKSLRFGGGDKQTWGVAVGRYIARLNEQSYWPAITQRIAGFVPQMASIVIPEKFGSQRNLQLNPYVYLGKSKILNTADVQNPLWHSENKISGGLDAKWVLGDSAALDFTLKPDFSQVESDDPQPIVDKRYEILFPEKRPFFIENAGLFQTPQPLFFSRRIAEPKAGARLTGREGNWSFGSLLIDDEAVGKDLTTTNSRYAKDAHITVGRLQNDFSSGSNVGVLLTDRRFAGQFDSVAGFDIHYKVNDNWSMGGQFAQSQTKDENGARSNGLLRYFEAKRTDRDFVYEAKYVDITPKFDTTLAFLPRTDIRQISQVIGSLWEFSDQSFFQKAGPRLTGILTKDQTNVLQDWQVDGFMMVTAVGNSNLVAHINSGYELFSGKDFHKKQVSFNGGTEWFSWLSGEASIAKSDAVNYSPAKGLDAFLGDARSFSANLVFKPHAQWRLEETLFVNDLRTKDFVANQARGTLVYRDLIARTKMTYQHNRFLGVRLVLDYDYLKTNPFLNDLKPGKRLNSDLQVSYVLSPGTTFYTGYSDRQENLILTGNPRRIQITDDLSLHTGRRIFAKLSYLFQP